MLTIKSNHGDDVGLERVLDVVHVDLRDVGALDFLARVVHEDV